MGIAVCKLCLKIKSRCNDKYMHTSEMIINGTLHFSILKFLLISIF